MYNFYPILSSNYLSLVSKDNNYPSESQQSLVNPVLLKNFRYNYILNYN